MKNKLKPIPKNSNTIETDSLPEKVSLQQLKAIWNDELHNYTDDELIKIRDWLYLVAKMVITVSQRMEKEHTLIKQQQIQEHSLLQAALARTHTLWLRDLEQLMLPLECSHLQAPERSLLESLILQPAQVMPLLQFTMPLD